MGTYDKLAEGCISCSSTICPEYGHLW